MRQLDENEILDVSGGLLPDYGYEGMTYVSEVTVDFVVGFIHGFVGSF